MAKTNPAPGPKAGPKAGPKLGPKLGNAMTQAQRDYEAKRAAKAGKSLDAWLSEKQKRQAAAEQKPETPKPPKKRGLIGRLLDRAHKPLG